MSERIAVAMSGGVDSSVAACLLLEQGWDAVGVTLQLLPGHTEHLDAARVAAQLGIPHHLLDLSRQFCQQVMDPFTREYAAGRTPNPCIRCNRHLKFGTLPELCVGLGCSHVATGHYARIRYDAPSGRYLLCKAIHPEKDQSYVLYCLTQEQLSRSRFPLGSLSKEEIRELAVSHSLSVAHKRDSQDICFIPDGDYGAFLRRHTGQEFSPGDFLDEQGAVLGRHTGIVDYTVGQRRGLGVSSNHGRLYVKQICPEHNTVVLSENAALFGSVLTARDVNFIPFDSLSAPLRLCARIRYHMAEQPCTVEQTGPDSLRVTFDQPQRAITPGQAVVFYDGDVVVGGATIEKGEGL